MKGKVEGSNGGDLIIKGVSLFIVIVFYFFDQVKNFSARESGCWQGLNSAGEPGCLKP